MDHTPGPGPNRLLRLAGSPPVFLAILFLVLTYLYLSGHFFRVSFTQGPIQALLATIVSVTLMLILYANLSFVLEGRRVSELALKSMAGELGTGVLLGFGLYSACILILMAAGVYRAEGLTTWDILLPGVAGPLATGVYEELVFRGGVFRLAEKWFGTWVGLVISAAVFGFVHLENEAATMQGILSISIWAGLLLTATYVLTRRLWLGIGLHAAWNFTQGTVYSGIVSGSAAPEPGLIRSTMHGPDWLTGGTFGVEASIVALLVCSACAIGMLAVASRQGRITPNPLLAQRASSHHP